MKRKIILYIAQSLDGYIASADSTIDWLPQEMGDKLTNFYLDFMKRIDTVAMGRKTYDQITTVLSPDVWPYTNTRSYIWTTRELSHPDCQPTKESISVFAEKFHSENGKDLWLVGGSNFVKDWINLDLVDEYIITTVPIILGNGIPLFHPQQNKIKLELIDTIIENGLIQSHYIRNNNL